MKMNRRNSLKSLEINKNKRILEKCFKSEQILNALNYESINKKKIKYLCSKGFSGINPDLESFRSILWKIMLEYLPEKKILWDEIIKSNKISYDILIDKFIEEPLKRKEILKDNLKVKQDNSLIKYYFDFNLWNDIEKDTKRSRNDVVFFNELSRNNFFVVDNYDKLVCKSNKSDILTRILYLYAKINPGFFFFLNIFIF